MMKNSAYTVAVIGLIMALTGCTQNVNPGSGATVEDYTRGSSSETYGIDNATNDGSSAYDEATSSILLGEDELYLDDPILSEPGSPLANRVVYFETDSNAVRREDHHVLEAHGRYLARHPNVTVRLEGHTDERGAREYNLGLGERRAKSVQRILMLQGAANKQFRATTYGEERPAFDGHSEAAWRQNRRVQIYYLGR